MRLYIELPIHLAQRVRERAERDMRPLRPQDVWLIHYALRQLEDEEARRQRPGQEAAGQEHQPHQGGEADAETK